MGVTENLDLIFKEQGEQTITSGMINQRKYSELKLFGTGFPFFT